MTLYIENPEHATKKPVRTDKFIKAVEYKINLYEPVVFLCISKGRTEKEIKKIIVFTKYQK
jgi:hypothetical protein